MNVLLLGQGGREHAIAYALNKSPSVARCFIAPGNAATEFGKCVNAAVDINDFKSIIAFSKENNVELVIPGPEQFLVDGVADECRKAGIYCFGPTKIAAKLEGSKAYSKVFMQKYDIPTAEFRTFTVYEDAITYIQSCLHDIVIKASGLCAGKGVFLPSSKQEAIENIASIMKTSQFGSAGSEVIIEKRLYGQEVSLLAFCDGYTAKAMPPAQDHKRVFDNDLGPNTGGMGVFAPVPFYTPSIAKEAESILQKTLSGMRAENAPFVGILYAGFMLTPDGPKVLEYNCRFGDPETQCLLPLLNSDLHEIMMACCKGSLDALSIQWKKEHSVCVVACSAGYPGKYTSKLPINISRTSSSLIFHSGTVKQGDFVVTNGGRVLSCVTVAPTLSQAVEQTYEALKTIKFDGMHYRMDIAKRALSYSSSTTYSDAGVSIQTGNSLIDMIKPFVKSTRRVGSDAEIGGFGGVFDLKACGYTDAVLVSGTDGVGTKLSIAQQCGIHDTIGIDLVAMSVNDVLVQGAEPLFFLDYFACGKLDNTVASNVVKGISVGCVESGCALIGGETAEMPGMYKMGEYDLAGFVVGAVERANILPKLDCICEGDVILGIPSSGIHSNGYSLVRHILASNDLTYSDRCPYNPSKTLGQDLLTPTRIYVKMLLPVIKSGKIKSMAHITGGGFIDNIPRCLPKGYGAKIDLKSYSIPPVFMWLKEKGNIEMHELYRTFNCGVGMVLVVGTSEVKNVIAMIQGETVYQLGTVICLKEDDKSVIIE